MQKSLRPEEIKKFKETITEEVIKSVTVLPAGLFEQLKKGRKNVTEREKRVLDSIVKNSEIAREKAIPLCQDTGIFEIWVELGRESSFRKADINNLINEAVREGHKRGNLRESMTGPAEAAIHIESGAGKNTRITITPRGFGSENYTSLHMLDPDSTFAQIKNIVIEDVKAADGRPCPPYLLGIGIGGTASEAVELSARALTEINFKFTKEEKEILDKVNTLSHGSGGMGGNLSALGVKILEKPSHIAGKALGVHIGCWCNRVRRFVLEEA
jgi:fumarate hydratase subunit alpha